MMTEKTVFQQDLSEKNSPEKIAYIALGSNLGPSGQILDQALQLIVDSGIKVLAVSRRYKTEPVGTKEAMPDFLNQVARVSCRGSCHDLLFEILLKTEERLGRQRLGAGRVSPTLERHYSARTLDLDLLLFGSEIYNTPNLTIPHPRMFERAFVLLPLLEVWDEEHDMVFGELLNNYFNTRATPKEHLQRSLKQLDWRLDCKADNYYISQK